MTFAASLTLTINAVDKVLKRQNQDNFGSFYRFYADDGSELIEMQVRHSTDKTPDGPVARHNIYIERTIYPTPTSAKKYWSVTFTLRELTASGPGALLQLSAGASALIGSLDDGLVLGEN